MPTLLNTVEASPRLGLDPSTPTASRPGPGTSIQRKLLVTLEIAILLAILTARARGNEVQPPVHPATIVQPARVEAALGPDRRERAQRFTSEGRRITVPQTSPLRSELVIAAVEAKEILRTLELPGVVEADPARTVKVLPAVAGRVIDVKVQLGDRVTEHQELATIYVGNLARTWFDSQGARPVPALTGNQIGFDAIGDGAAVNRQAIEFEQAPAQLRALAVPLEGTQDTRLVSLKAPIAGSVIELKLSTGAIVEDLSVPMMRIANLDTILLTTNLPKGSMVSIATGQPVQVRFPAYPGEEFKGETREIGSTFGADIRSMKARIALRNPNIRLKPNMFGYATFLGPKETAPIVPIAALVPTYKKDLVFVEVEPWVFEAREIGISLLQHNEVVVARGLKIGDRVVVRGCALLLESQAQ